MMRFDKFTEQAQEAARRSYEVMQRYGHTQVDVEHIFLALLEQPQGLIVEMLGRMGAPIEIMKERLDDNLQHTPRVGRHAHRTRRRWPRSSSPRG